MKEKIVDLKRFSGKTILYDQLEYYYENEGDKIRAYIDVVKGFGLDELTSELVNLTLPTDKAKELDKDTREMRKEVIRILIAKSIDAATTSHVHYLVDVLHEELSDVEKRLQALEKFDNHRHKTMLGLYTEKAIY